MKLLVVVFFLFNSVSFSQTSNFIEVTGTANVEYPADQINWTVDIRKIADTFEESTDQVNSVLKELLGIIDQIGIDKNDVKVSPLQQTDTMKMNMIERQKYLKDLYQV